METPDILKKIIKARKQRLENEKILYPPEKIMDMARRRHPPSFLAALNGEGLSVIAEVKKASPSRGIIKEAFDPVNIAMQYNGAADAISVLTEMDFFMGSPEYLRKISEAVSLPLLRKDFIIDPYQIYEAKALGASCVLLIAALLEGTALREFICIAGEAGLDALVEVHQDEEMEAALLAGADIIGINNRDLHTFQVDISTTIRLSAMVPEDKLLISESGITSVEDVKKLKSVRLAGILTGESLMRSAQIRETILGFKEAYGQEKDAI